MFFFDFYCNDINLGKYTDTIKKLPLYIYVNLLQANAVFSFNYFASRNVIIFPLQLSSIFAFYPGYQ